MTRIVTIIGVSLLPAVAIAHPDHASTGDFGLLHFVTDPFHLGLTDAALLTYVVARRALRLRRAEDPRQR
jgi:hypothetical protein